MAVRFDGGAGDGLQNFSGARCARAYILHVHIRLKHKFTKQLYLLVIAQDMLIARSTFLDGCC